MNENVKFTVTGCWGDKNNDPKACGYFTWSGAFTEDQITNGDVPFEVEQFLQRLEKNRIKSEQPEEEV